MSIRNVISGFSNLRRREFLKTLGATVGGLAVGQLPLTSKMVAGARPRELPTLSHMPTIGLLLPRSGMHPHLGENLAAGLRLSLDEATPQGRSDPNKLRIEEVGIRPSETLEKARTLIAKDEVDILVGVINPSVAIDLHNTLESSRPFLILAEAGANIVREVEHSPYVFHNTLGYWRASWATGEWAVRNLGKRVFVASSFYESGYDALHAFRLGAERAGGKVVQTCISHIPPHVMDMNRLMGAMNEARPDAVFAMYSGEEALEFVRAFSTSSLVGQIPLICSSFMTENAMLERIGMAIPGTANCSSWAPGVQNPENESFKIAFKEMTGRNADSFAVLGYDTGRLIIETSRTVESELRNPPLVREALRQATFTSPRGVLRMDPETHNMMTPLYLCEVRVHAHGVVNLVKDELKPAPESNQTVMALRGETRTGWLNAYLNA
jgi:branched-chain amino acid transport system substrate-binding protein